MMDFCIFIGNLSEMADFYVGFDLLPMYFSSAGRFCRLYMIIFACKYGLLLLRVDFVAFKGDFLPFCARGIGVIL